MMVAMMQPTFLPWQGFFELIREADRFIFLDDFQFCKRSWHQRNRLFGGGGRVEWYTVPHKAGSCYAPLNQTQIADEQPWRKKTWQCLRLNYGKTPFFPVLAPQLEKWLLTPSESLAEFNIGFISWACNLLELRPEFRRSSERPSELKRSERNLDLLRWCGADTYFSARGSFEYMRTDGIFPTAEVRVVFQDYHPRPYPQAGTKGEFVPSLSILDALLNIGPQATAKLLAGGTPRRLEWEELASAMSPEDRGLTNAL